MLYGPVHLYITVSIASKYTGNQTDQPLVDVIETPRYEDFDLSYHDKNPWAHLGMGYSVNNYNGNFSPYLGKQFIDPKWLKAVGSPMPTPQANGHKDQAVKEAAVVPENAQLKGVTS
jgi:hypothetical protein